MKMEADKTFINILCKPEFDVDGYKEVVISVNKKRYFVKIPYQNISSYIKAMNMIRYRTTEHIRTSPPKKRGRKKIYSSDDERRKAYIERRKNGLLNPNFRHKVIKAMA